jgi:aryl-alcohol dehydrogenase-like predicted oxidoreductase
MSIQGRPDEAHSIGVIHAALDAGITFIDTADVYCLDDTDIGHNERLIAKALAAWPSADVVLATKGGLERPGGAWVSNGRPEHLRAACERSLVALGVERIDLYQLHAPDPGVPFADSVGALAELRREGKIRHVGLSNVDVSHIREAQDIVPVVSVQNRCNLFDTGSFENGVITYCEEHDIAFLPHSPMGGHRGHNRLSQHEELGSMAARLAVTPYELALAYLLAISPVMIPIPGASRTASIESSARGAEISLSDEDLAALRRMFPEAVPA